MKRICLLLLLGCGGRAPPASQPVASVAAEAPPPPPRASPKSAAKCSEWLDEALFEPIEGGRDGVLETRLERCEKTLLTATQMERVAKAPGGLLEALATDLLPELDRDQVAGYMGLVSRFALARGVKRLVYFGPLLRPAFDALTKKPGGPCDVGQREAALFMLLSPKALGGQEEVGHSMLQKSLGTSHCPVDQYVLVDALLLRGEIKKAEEAFAQFQRAKPASGEFAVFERVRTTLSERLQQARRPGREPVVDRR